MLDDLDLSGVMDPEARRILDLLRNVIEVQAGEIATLRAENQRLRDEVNRLKGEQGAPTILPTKRVAAAHASERERRAERPARPRVDKRSLLHIDRTEEREVDPALLPSDAERKGSVEFVVQDVALRTDTVLFRCALVRGEHPTELSGGAAGRLAGTRARWAGAQSPGAAALLSRPDERAEDPGGVAQRGHRHVGGTSAHAADRAAGLRGGV